MYFKSDMAASIKRTRGVRSTIRDHMCCETASNVRQPQEKTVCSGDSCAPGRSHMSARPGFTRLQHDEADTD
jgi:hypothetical protein